mgnify:CR=1 FL=1
MSSQFHDSLFNEYLIEENDARISAATSFISQIPKAVHKAPANVFRKSAPDVNARTYDTDLNVGQRVRHKKFGDGTVTAIQRFEKDAMVEIKFDSGETKRLMAVFAKLEKI